jgi:soluble lytic murein transglycosylase-like protein
MIRKTFFLLTLFFSNMAIADIYKFVDSNGRVYYTDEQRHGLYKRIIKTSPYRLKMRESSIYPGSIHSPYRSTAFHSPYRSNVFHTPYRSFSNSYNYGFNSRSFNKTKFSSVIANAAYRNRVDEKLVHAVIQTESAYNAGARSPAGAVGLMQLMPDTARRYGVLNRTDPVQNVDGGTRYLKDLLGMFNYNLRLAVAAYNAGENAVIRHNNSIPPYPETQNYVRQVLALYNQSL